MVDSHRRFRKAKRSCKFLRQHYLDQVHGSFACRAKLSALFAIANWLAPRTDSTLGRFERSVNCRISASKQFSVQQKIRDVEINQNAHDVHKRRDERG